MNESLTKGQSEDIITKAAIKSYVENFGVGPKEARAYIIEDMIIVRFKGKFLPIEEKMLKEKEGVKMVKRSKEMMFEIFLDHLGKVISEITHRHVISSHSDFSTKTGEKIKIFILDKNYEEELIKKTEG